MESVASLTQSAVSDLRTLARRFEPVPFGGERAPAGPRYERNGSIRRSWDRPVAWAGLDKMPPTPTDEAAALQRRANEIAVELNAAQVRLADEISRLRSLHEGRRALAAEGSPATAADGAAQAVVDATRDEIAGLVATDRCRGGLAAVEPNGVPAAAIKDQPARYVS